MQYIEVETTRWRPSRKPPRHGPKGPRRRAKNSPAVFVTWVLSPMTRESFLWVQIVECRRYGFPGLAAPNHPGLEELEQIRFDKRAA